MTCEHCSKPVLAKGMCSMHYNRAHKYGSPFVVKSPRFAAQEFLADLTESDDCILWPFKGRYSNGYGAVTFKGRVTGAHRAACHIHIGPPPSETHQAAHSCGVKLCVNPRHLRWASPRENAADKVGHDTAPIGERNGHAKLKNSDIPKIRSLRGSMSQTAIAKQFGVSRRAIGMILSNQTWKAA